MFRYSFKFHQMNLPHGLLIITFIVIVLSRVIFLILFYHKSVCEATVFVCFDCFNI